MANQETQLQALLDREAIRDLPLRYCDCVWRDDVDGLVKLFAKDGAFTMTHLSKAAGAKGHPALRKFYREGFGIGPRPYIHNHVISLDGTNRASGRCYLALHSIKHDMQFIGAGYYADDYVKIKNEWKFLRRQFTALRIDEAPNLSSAPTKKKPAPKRAR
jgi:SnoaL-like domain